MSGSDSDSSGRKPSSRRFFDLKQPAPAEEPARLSRRIVLKGGAAAAGLAIGGAFRGAPMVWAQTIKDITLRQFGTGVSAYNDIAVEAKKALGFTIEVAAL